MQTLAIFLEAYRNLNAKKMFWIVLALSVLVVGFFACIGINENGITFCGMESGNGPFTGLNVFFNTDSISPELFYKMLFMSFGIGFWLTWLATILALVSTAGIFPDLINGGAIGLVVSKPIGRLRLFLTQYLAGLLFVTLQVTVFSLAAFLVIGVRGDAWEPSLFLAIPVVVCFFSYLFAVCVFLGLLTRSTVASLLLTLLFWFGISILEGIDNVALQLDLEDKRVAAAEAEAKSAPEEPEAPEEPPGADGQLGAFPPGGPPQGQRPEIPTWVRQGLKGVQVIYFVSPKTTATIGLLERSLIDMADLPEPPSDDPFPEMRANQLEFAEAMRARSAWWIVGTSLGFEIVMLGLAALIFCRRDF